MFAPQKNSSLIATDLWKSYQGRVVVRGISLSLASGEILGLLGPNGAGKTTTVGMLYGAVIPDQGQVVVHNYEIKTQGRKAREYIGIVPQENNLDSDLNVLENLLAFAHHYGLVGKRALGRAQQLLQEMGVEDYARYAIHQLSGGLKRRLVLARALLHNPSVLFLDEPTTGLDPEARQGFWKLIAEQKLRGGALLLTTHYMDEAERLCDRILLLQDGQIIDEGSPADLISKHVGEETLEIDGIDETSFRDIVSKGNTWYRPFGSGFLLGVPENEFDLLWQNLTQLHPTQLARRKANLEDVFLILTGRMLGGDPLT